MNRLYRNRSKKAHSEEDEFNKAVAESLKDKDAVESLNDLELAIEESKKSQQIPEDIPEQMPLLSLSQSFSMGLSNYDKAFGQMLEIDNMESKTISMGLSNYDKALGQMPTIDNSESKTILEQMPTMSLSLSNYDDRYDYANSKINTVKELKENQDEQAIIEQSIKYLSKQLYKLKMEETKLLELI